MGFTKMANGFWSDYSNNGFYLESKVAQSISPDVLAEFQLMTES